MSRWQIEFVAAAALATLYLHRRFGGSAQNRSYTTARRYYVGFALLATVHLGVFFTFAAGLSFLGGELAEHLTGSRAWVRTLLDSPSWMAFVTVFVLPRLGLSQVDGVVWRFSKRLAGIPEVMDRLRKRLVGSGLEVNPEIHRQIQLNLRRRGQDFFRMKAGADASIGSLWSRASILMHHLDTWESGETDRDGEAQPLRALARVPDYLSRGAYSRFMYDNKHRHENLRSRYDYISFKAGRVFDQIDRLGTLAERTTTSTAVSAASAGDDDEWGSLQTMVEARVFEKKETNLAPVMGATRMLLADLRHDMDFFMKDACGLVARGVLHCETTRRGRISRLRKLGFQDVEEPSETNLDSMAYVFLVVMAVLFIGFSVLGTGADAGGGRSAFLVNLVTMISLQQLVAIGCAVLPKLHFGFANADLRGHRPYPFFLGAGLCAAGLSFVLGVGFRYLRLPDWDATWSESLAKSPWLLIPFTVAVVVAVLVQDEMASATLSERSERRRDAICLAVSMVLTCTVVQYLLPLAGCCLNCTPPSMKPLILSAIMGLAIGWIVPYSFRERLHELRPQRHPRAGQVTSAAS